MKDEFDLLQEYLREYIDNMFKMYSDRKKWYYYYDTCGIAWVTPEFKPFPNTYQKWIDERIY